MDAAVAIAIVEGVLLAGIGLAWLVRRRSAQKDVVTPLDAPCKADDGRRSSVARALDAAIGDVGSSRGLSLEAPFALIMRNLSEAVAGDLPPSEVRKLVTSALALLAASDNIYQTRLGEQLALDESIDGNVRSVLTSTMTASTAALKRMASASEPELRQAVARPLGSPLDPIGDEDEELSHLVHALDEAGAEDVRAAYPTTGAASSTGDVLAAAVSHDSPAGPPAAAADIEAPLPASAPSTPVAIWVPTSPAGAVRSPSGSDPPAMRLPGTALPLSLAPSDDSGRLRPRYSSGSSRVSGADAGGGARGGAGGSPLAATGSPVSFAEDVQLPVSLPLTPRLMDLVQQLPKWDVDMMELQEASGGNALLVVGSSAIYQHQLATKLRLPPPLLHKFLAEVQAGYKEQPYHSAMHAADVTHAANYFLTNWPMAASVAPLNVLALLLSAASHDYGHPARTNAFLVATLAPLAVTYNDSAVLENYHIASSWRLFMEAGIPTRMPSREVKALRTLMIKLVLATDMSKHMESVNIFQSRLPLATDDEALEAVEEQLDVSLQLLIKTADLSHVAKRTDLHLRWSNAITEEFLAQGDEERKLGLPVAVHMDREKSVLPKSQLGFIHFVAAPLVAAFTGVTGITILSERLESNTRYWRDEERRYDAAQLAADSPSGASHSESPVREPALPKRSVRHSILLARSLGASLRARVMHLAEGPSAASFSGTSSVRTVRQTLSDDRLALSS
eukprot:PLAT7938.3.p1 GENE.PLAT7938.3~~PLAT7938.3.p1  ORF type:complete len:735 (+),score=283.30 PLAT7938.3:49-2253(+)